MFREYSEEGLFSILVPYRAHSAATVMCLGADEIVMTKKAELGPIDITIISGPYNPTEKDSNQRLPVSVEDVMGYFTFLEKIECEESAQKMGAFEQLTSKVHPLVIGHVNRLLEQTKLVAHRLLGTRAEPFEDEINDQIVKRLSSEIYSHRHTINRTEAIDHLEMTQIVKAEDLGIDDELWQLYCLYREMFDLESRFAPEEFLIANELEENTWMNLKLACIESEKRLDVFSNNLRVRRTRKIPTQVQLSIGNIQLPSINFPKGVKSVSPQQLQNVLNQILQEIMPNLINDAANNIVKQFLKSLPTAGFEHIGFNAGWKKRS
jgi:ClpP class serine protease